eukprot:1149435-Pelagomonas_calceolata.AAC.7
MYIQLQDIACEAGFGMPGTAVLEGPNEFLHVSPFGYLLWFGIAFGQSKGQMCPYIPSVASTHDRIPCFCNCGITNRACSVSRALESSRSPRSNVETYVLRRHVPLQS